MIQTRREFTEADRLEHAQNMEVMLAQTEHVQKLKQMELETKKAEIQGRLEAAKASRESQERIRNAELELARIEARWLSWLRIPVTILKLPLYIVLGVAVCIAVARKHEPPEKLWHLLK